MLYHFKKVFHRIIGKYQLERAFLHATRSQVYNLQPLLSQEYACHGLLTKEDHPWCKERRTQPLEWPQHRLPLSA